MILLNLAVIMSNINDPQFLVGAPVANPRMREELAARIQGFHEGVVAGAGQPAMLQAYYHGLRNWVLNPNTDVYHIEMLFDEICHAVQAQGSEKQAATARAGQVPRPPRTADEKNREPTRKGPDQLGQDRQGYLQH
jgi:hypothetical protein